MFDVVIDHSLPTVDQDQKRSVRLEPTHDDEPLKEIGVALEVRGEVACAG